tara:strand:- start:893 stop:1096 length:204 start_codon:yes stop_codon:yes gene_type:complete
VPFLLNICVSEKKMPRGRLDKNSITGKVVELKNELYNGVYDDASKEWKEGSHHQLNRVLDFLNEYSN